MQKNLNKKYENNLTENLKHVTLIFIFGENFQKDFHVLFMGIFQGEFSSSEVLQQQQWRVQSLPSK